MGRTFGADLNAPTAQTITAQAGGIGRVAVMERTFGAELFAPTAQTITAQAEGLGRVATKHVRAEGTT